MQSDFYANTRLAGTRSDDLVAAAERRHRAAAAQGAARPAAGVCHAVGTALVRLGAYLRGARPGTPAPAAR
jgi:hypothetical protein